MSPRATPMLPRPGNRLIARSAARELSPPRSGNYPRRHARERRAGRGPDGRRTLGVPGAVSGAPALGDAGPARAALAPGSGAARRAHAALRHPRHRPSARLPQRAARNRSAQRSHRVGRGGHRRQPARHLSLDDRRGGRERDRETRPSAAHERRHGIGAPRASARHRGPAREHLAALRHRRAARRGVARRYRRAAPRALPSHQARLRHRRPGEAGGGAPVRAHAGRRARSRHAAALRHAGRGRGRRARSRRSICSACLGRRRPTTS